MEHTNPPIDDAHCLNCGAILNGKYCSDCGQKVLPPRQSIGDLIVNFIGSFTSFESKFFRTLKFLLLKPWCMIIDYNSGRRERYYHPARMYVFLSFIFFLFFSIGSNDPVVMVNGDRKNSEESKNYLDSLQVAMDTINWGQYGVSKDPDTIEQYDSIENAKEPKDRDGMMERFFTRKSIRWKQQYGGNYGAMMAGFSASFKENTPKMIFLLLPIMALILWLLYIRHDVYYSEHLVFTVFFYDFLFFVGVFMQIVSMINWISWLRWILILYILFFLYKSMRKVYSQSRAKTILKYVLLLMVFSFTLIIALGINAMITLSLM